MREGLGPQLGGAWPRRFLLARRLLLTEHRGALLVDDKHRAAHEEDHEQQNCDGNNQETETGHLY